MELRVNSIHFDATESLKQFVAKKAASLARHNPSITYIDVNMRVVKPETAENKEVVVKVTVPHNGEIVTTKVADTFEEGVVNALEAASRQLEKIKDAK